MSEVLKPVGRPGRSRHRVSSSSSVPPDGAVSTRCLVVSRDSYEFDPAASRWTLSKDVVLDLTLVLDLLAEPLREPYRAVMKYYAKYRSPAYCSGIHQGIRKLLRDTGANAFSESVLRSYRASLDRTHECRLGTVRSFLRRWHDQGYPGVSSEAVDYLSSIRLRGNEKGVDVLTLDPKRGPFDDQEFEAALTAADQHFERGEICLSTLAFYRLLVHTGRRPGQLSQLRLSDLQHITTPDGRRIETVRIPRSKQRGCAPRDRFKHFWCDPDLRRLLGAQREVVIERVQARLGELPQSLLDELPLFPNWSKLEDLASAGALEAALRNDGLHTTLRSVKAGLSRIEAFSARTGGRLRIAPKRFRYTLGTRAAREGYGALVIAELLDHSDVQNVGVYTRAHANFRKKIDDAAGRKLVPLAHAFAGTLIDSEAEARHGDDPGMRVGMQDKPVGTCGSAGFCGAQAYACYTCLHFQPWLDAPHHRVLKWFLRERRRSERSGASPRVVAATDQSIAAVRCVIEACEARRAELSEDES